MRWFALVITVAVVVGMGIVFVPLSTAAISADFDLLNKVKQAGLWEMPVGAELAERGQIAQVRDIGRRISAEHHELDEKTNIAAATVGATLPTEPNPDQQYWMTEVAQANSNDIDRIAVNRLRAAHGKVLPLLAQVKVGTRDPVIRAFATDAMIYVSRHISYLESTGLVDYNALPEATAATSNSYVGFVVWGSVGLGVLLALWWVYRRREHTIPQHRRK